MNTLTYFGLVSPVISSGSDSFSFLNYTLQLSNSSNQQLSFSSQSLYYISKLSKQGLQPHALICSLHCHTTYSISKELNINP